MFPAPAGDFDQIEIEVTKASRVAIYAAETYAYSDPSTQYIELAQDDAYTLTFPNSLYITVVSKTVQSTADFAIEYRFNDRDPATVLETLSEAERDSYLQKKVIIKQEKIYEDWTFWVLIAAGVFGLAIMVTLCACLVSMKQRNDEIISKVVLMAERKRRNSDVDRPRTLETGGEGGPVASSKPFRGDEDEGSVSQSGMLVEGVPVSSPPKDKAGPKMLFASRAAVGVP